MQKKQQLTENKNILNIKMSVKGGPVFTFSLPRGGFAPCSPVSYATGSTVVQGPMKHSSLFYIVSTYGKPVTAYCIKFLKAL